MPNVYYQGKWSFIYLISNYWYRTTPSMIKRESELRRTIRSRQKDENADDKSNNNLDPGNAINN